MEEEQVYVSRLPKEAVSKMNFPAKLWVIINTPNDAINWGRNGSTVLINHLALDDYLCSPFSLFKTKTRANFLENFKLYGFKELSALPEQGECYIDWGPSISEYRHDNFLQNRADLVSDIRINPSTQSKDETLSQSNEISRQSVNTTERRQPDPCNNVITKISDVEKARLNLQMLLQLQTGNFELDRKTRYEQQTVAPNSVTLIQLPSGMFENPYESVSKFEESGEVEGFYGRATGQQVKEFFGEYLPKCSKTKDKPVTREVKKVQKSSNISSELPSFQVTDLPHPVVNPYNHPSENPSNAQIQYATNVGFSGNKDFAFLEDQCPEVTCINTNGATFEYRNVTPAERNYSSATNVPTLEPVSLDYDEDNIAYSREDISEEIDVGNQENVSMDHYMKDGEPFCEQATNLNIPAKRQKNPLKKKVTQIKKV